MTWADRRPRTPLRRRRQQTFSFVATNLQLGVAGVLRDRRHPGRLAAAQRHPRLSVIGAEASVTVDGTDVVTLGGYASFTITRRRGFRLSSLQGDHLRLFPSPALGRPTATTASSTPTTRPVLFPTADLANPLNRATVVRDRDPERYRRHRSGSCSTTATGWASAPPASRDAAPEFEVWINGVQGDPRHAAWAPTARGLRQGQHLGLRPSPAACRPPAWSRSGSSPAASPTTPASTTSAETEQFYVVEPRGQKPGPIAVLASPGNGETVTVARAQRPSLPRRHLHQPRRHPDQQGLDRGRGRRVQAHRHRPGGRASSTPAGSPIIVGLPLLIAGRGADATSVTYRYFLKRRRTPGTRSTCSSPATSCVTFLGTTAHAAWTTGAPTVAPCRPDYATARQEPARPDAVVHARRRPRRVRRPPAARSRSAR